MKTNIKYAGFCIVASVLLIACSSQTGATPLVDSFTIATFTPTLTSTPSNTATTIPTAIPSITPPIGINSSEFCIGQITPWSCSCGDLSNEIIQIKNASPVGMCEITVPLEDHEAVGYNITLPENWFCKVVGVASNNLHCFSDNDQEIFLQSLVTELPITQADEAINIFQEGEGHWSNPIVGVDEERISRDVVTIGDKQVLKLLTHKNDAFILRYFIKSKDSLYVLSFEMKDPDIQKSKKTSIMLEEAILSMQFRQ